MIRLIQLATLSALAICCMVLAILSRDPLIYSRQSWALLALAIAILFTIALALRRQWIWAACFLLCAGISLNNEWQYQRQKARVLATSPDQLRPLGQRLIVGYRDPQMIEALVERQAIGGVFITAKNVRDHSPKEFRQWIDHLQSIQASNHLPPLWIACDQEGGPVDRLSPPLPKGPALSSFINTDGHYDAATINDWGHTQAQQLRSLGVNMNFSPVVDVPPPDSGSTTSNPLDRLSQISTRAISADPMLVGEVAAHYSLGLRTGAVLPVAKHFPGLGKVDTDTHQFPAHLDTSLAEWQKSDALPFAMLGQLGEHAPAVMIAHANFDAIDADTPSSVSQPVIALAREILGPDARLITDDINMVPTYYRKGGPGKSTQDALAAGADWVLISYMGETYYQVMDYLLSHSIK